RPLRHGRRRRSPQLTYERAHSGHRRRRSRLPDQDRQGRNGPCDRHAEAPVWARRRQRTHPRRDRCRIRDHARTCSPDPQQDTRVAATADTTSPAHRNRLTRTYRMTYENDPDGRYESSWRFLEWMHRRVVEEARGDYIDISDTAPRNRF